MFSPRIAFITINSELVLQSFKMPPNFEELLTSFVKGKIAQNMYTFLFFFFLQRSYLNCVRLIKNHIKLLTLICLVNDILKATFTPEILLFLVIKHKKDKLVDFI